MQVYIEMFLIFNYISTNVSLCYIYFEGVYGIMSESLL